MNQTLCLLVLCLSVCVVFSSVEKKDDDAPKVFNYTVFDSKSGNFCVVLQAGVRLNFNYTYDKNKTKEFSIDLAVPYQNGTFENVTGTCGKDIQSIMLPVNDREGWNVTLTFNLTKDTKYQEIILASVIVNYREDNKTFPMSDSNKTFTASQTNMTIWNTPNGQGFWCHKSEDIDFKQKLALTQIQLSNMKVEAFRKKNTTDIDPYKYTQCEQDNEMGNIVPIAVGAALGALVLIVLIAYLVGRKRNIRGYESV